ncbi:MAG: hypothetical protein GY811_16765 [Myxococcales bacterium]|nr:hypothetical protein [Myxococcales bacterium]
MNLGAGNCLVLGAALRALLGCHKTFAASVAQPNSLAQPLDPLRRTEEITIVTGDMDLVRSSRSSERWP